MSIHVCKCEHKGRAEYHLRYPGMTQDEAQALADRINGGELVGADHPLRKDAERYRKWRAAYTNPDGRPHALDPMLAALADAWSPAQVDAAIDVAPVLGAA